MANENEEDIGPLLMHDPDEEETHSLSPHSAENLLSDVHLPDSNNFTIPPHHEKEDQLSGIDQSIDAPEKDTDNLKIDGGEVEAESIAIKFPDGQPVQLEDGSTAYILTNYKEGTQPIILEDGTTAYISHEPPTSLFETPLENNALELDNLQPEKRSGVTHIGDQKVFKCDVTGCDKVYTTFHHLQYHKRSHMEKKPFVCGYAGCEKTFATSYGLKSHVRVHTGEKPYKCPETDCEKGFKTSGDLQKHIRTHTGEKPFVCPFEGCNRSFTTSNIRKVHIRTHTGERPYSCDQCSRTFASATNHKNHMRIHTGEKPYACTYEGCNKRFTEYSSLYKHHVVHTQAKPYICSTCGKHYRQTSTLAMHKRSAHGETDPLNASEGDVIAGQLIALDQNKELVGIITSNTAAAKSMPGTTTIVNTSKILNTTAAVASSLAARSRSKPAEIAQQMSFAGLEGQNVVIISDTSGFRVLHTQVDAVSTIGNNIQHSTLPGPETSFAGKKPRLDSSLTRDEQTADASSSLVILSEPLDARITSDNEPH